MKRRVTHDSFRLAEPFTISRGSRTVAEVLTVSLREGEITGWGECVPYSRYDESIESVTGQINSLPDFFDREQLASLLPPGAARNALDCALWDLEAKQRNTSVWKLAGLSRFTGRSIPRPEPTAFTLSLDTPQRMMAAASRNKHRPLLKIKLGTPEDLPRLEAVRQGAPNSRIIVDANEGWSVDDYHRLAPRLLALGVEMVEQPFPAGNDSALETMERPVRLCADESCHDRASLATLAGKYDVVNIKLDKTGGLTEALALRSQAASAGFGIMVGCMVGSSLAMAPAVLLAQGADFVDLDGPLLLAEDRPCPLVYDEDGVHPPPAELWGQSYQGRSE